MKNLGIYARFKRDPEGFRALVELLESTPHSRRKKMIELGLVEDKWYTEEAVKYIMSFEDILMLPDLEMAELMAVAQPRTVGTAIHPFGEEMRQKFLRNSKPPVATEIRDYLEAEPSLRDIGGAQLSVIGTARGLERKGLINVKKIPVGGPVRY